VNPWLSNSPQRTVIVRSPDGEKYAEPSAKRPLHEDQLFDVLKLLAANPGGAGINVYRTEAYDVRTNPIGIEELDKSVRRSSYGPLVQSLFITPTVPDGMALKGKTILCPKATVSAFNEAGQEIAIVSDQRVTFYANSQIAW